MPPVMSALGRSGIVVSAVCSFGWRKSSGQSGLGTLLRRVKSGENFCADPGINAVVLI